jgi:hypothetical protein
MADARDKEVPKHRSSKDTKRWCRGKLGTEHDYQYAEWRLAGFRPGVVYSHLVCTQCGKHGNAYVGLGWGGNHGPGF